MQKPCTTAPSKINTQIKTDRIKTKRNPLRKGGFFRSFKKFSTIRLIGLCVALGICLGWFYAACKTAPTHHRFKGVGGGVKNTINFRKAA